MIKYIGKKYLDSNFYKQISIIQDGDCIEVKVEGNGKEKSLDKLDTMPITSQIENLDDYHKIEQIVSYFLRNNIIGQVAMDNNNNLVITSKSLRKLIFGLGEEYEKIEYMIIDKYSVDRLKFIDASTKAYIYFTTVHINDEKEIIYDVSNYYEGVDPVNHAVETIVLTLMSDGSETEVALFDKKFMIEYIKEALYSTSQKVEIWPDSAYYGIEIRFSNKVIRVPKMFEEEILFMVHNRNINIDEINQKQYKLEGII